MSKIPEAYVGRPIVDQNGTYCGVQRSALSSLLVIEGYRDEEGTIWTPPTAYAYAMICKAHHLRRDELEALLSRHAKGPEDVSGNSKS